MAFRYTLLLAASALYAVFLALTLVPKYLARRRFKQANGCLPVQRKYPHRDPFFGLDMIRERLQAAKQHRNMELATHTYFEQLQGNTFSCRVFTTNIISTIEPENVKTVLSLKFKDYQLGQRLRVMGPVFGEGIFTTDGDSWAHSRALIRPNFAREQVADLDALEQHVGDLIAVIPRDGSTVDLQELFFRLTMDSATQFLFGTSVHSLRSEASGDVSEKGFAWAFNHAQEYLAMRFRMGRLAALSRTSQIDRDAIKICHEFVDKFVDEAVKYRQSREKNVESTEEGSYVFLHQLARQTDNKQRLRDELLNVLLAGRDTTAGLLGNFFFVLAKKPEIWRKLKQEIDENLRGELPTYEQLKSLKYLKWCLNESLRLHPVVPGNSRRAVCDTVLPRGGGPDGRSPLFVPKGTLVAYQVWCMHRRKDFYGADADEFRPERWADLRPGWEYLPFNGGPRICIGQQYALTEASYVTVRILQEFKNIESRDSGPWTENLTLTLSSLATKVALIPA